MTYEKTGRKRSISPGLFQRGSGAPRRSLFFRSEFSTMESCMFPRPADGLFIRKLYIPPKKRSNPVEHRKNA